MDNGKEEETNTFLSSSLRSSPTSEETDLPKQDANQTASTLVADEEPKAIEQRQPSPSTENEDANGTSATPSSGLNPDSAPFFAPSVVATDQDKAVSTGNESDDEQDTGESRPAIGR